MQATFSPDKVKSVWCIKKTQNTTEKKSGFVILCYIRACLDEGQIYLM